MYYWFGKKINTLLYNGEFSPWNNWMSPFTASVSIRQRTSLWDDPYVAVISNIPRVIIYREQRIFPGLSFLWTPSLLITDPQLISTAQCVVY